jgi:hypothetical protein
MPRISVRIAPEQAEMLDGWASELATTRSLLVRGLLERAIASESRPTPALSGRERRERELDLLVERLNAAARS